MEVRYQLSDICFKLASRIKVNTEANTELTGALLSLGAFVLDTVKRDLRRGRSIANANESKRLQLESALNELKCSYKFVQYHLRNEIEGGQISREQALRRSEDRRKMSFGAFDSTASSLLSDAGSSPSLLDWARTAIMPNVDRVRDQWLEFDTSLKGSFHQDVTQAEVSLTYLIPPAIADLEESRVPQRRLIVQAFQFPTTGHCKTSATTLSARGVPAWWLTCSSSDRRVHLRARTSLRD